MNGGRGWAWTGGLLMPRHHLDQDHSHKTPSGIKAGHQEQGSQPPHGNQAGPKTLRYCDPRDQAQNPSGPTCLHVHLAHRVHHSDGGP